MLRIPCMRRSVAPLRGNPFNFRWALQRCANRAAGLFARQVLGTLALTSICNQWTNSIFFQRSLWTRSSFCADWLKIPRDFREKYILKNKIKKLKKEEEKKTKIDSILSRWSNLAVYVRGTHLRTHVDYTITGAQAAGPHVFAVTAIIPSPIFPPSHCNPPASRCVQIAPIKHAR